MKNLKYIFALSSVFVSLFAFSYATNFDDPKTDTDTNKNDKNNNSDTDQTNNDLINDQIKKKIINNYNNHFLSIHNLKLNKGNLIYKNENKPVSLDFSGFYSITNNALNSYVIDTTYTYESSSEKFQVNSGSINYSTITYNNKVYLFSSTNELSSILSFPSTKDTKYPTINLDYNFSTVFNSFLKLDSNNYEVLSSPTGYTFTSNNTTIKVDSNYDLLEIKSNYNDLLTLSLNFKDLDESSSTSQVVEDSTDFTNTLKGLFNDNEFDISYVASIKSSTSSDLKYNGYVSYQDDSLSLNVNEYIDNNLQNEINSTFKDENIYFNISNGKEKGNLIDSEITDLVSVTSGLMSTNTEFDYSFNYPLNALLNTSTFQSILNFNLSSSYIKDLKEEENIKTFKFNSKAFNFTSDFDIRFELGLKNNSLKSISIKDFKTTTTSVMDVEFTINNTKSNTFKINTEAYPVYNSLLPYYKKVIFIINEIQAGGNFTTSIIDNNSQTVLGLSTHYDVNLGKSVNDISLDNLDAALTDLEINFKDCTDSNKTSSIATALFLEDTTSTSQNTFDLSIKNLNYKNKTFYITLEENGSQNKYTLKSESIKGLISSIQKVTGSSTTQNNSTTKGFSAIKNEIDRIKELASKIQGNTIIKDLINDVKNGCNFSNIPKYITISIEENNVKASFNLNSLLGESTIKEYGLCTGITLTLLKDKNEIVSLQTSDITFDGMSTNNSSTQTNIGFNDFQKDNILDDTKINNEWINTIDKPNNSKNLDDIVDKIDDVIQIYNKAIAKNSILQSLIDIDFVYKDKSLKGSLSTKFHFDDETNIDDKYIEGSIPVSFENANGEANSLYGMNLEFIYSDKDKDKSKFSSLVDNSNKLSSGTQIGLSLNYGENDSRNNSKLYAYSDHDTVNSMLDSLSGIGDTNTLWPYEVIRTVQNYAQSVKEVLNQEQVNTMDILKKLGINDTKGVMDLLNGLNYSKTTLTARVNLGSLVAKDGESKDKLSEFNVDITLNFNVTYTESEDENGNKISTKNVSLDSIDAKSVENQDLSCKITLKSNSLEGDTTATYNTTYNVLPNFTPIKDSSSGNVNYIDASNVYNLLQLGIYTTNRKYYRINGTLNFDSNAIINLPILGNITFDEIKPLNNLNFDIKLNLFKDEGNSGLNDIYKIKGYLKVQQQKNTNKITEFFIEPGTTDATGTIYVAQSTKGDNYSEIKGTSYNEDKFKEIYNSEYSDQYSSYELTSKNLIREAYSQTNGQVIGTYSSRSDAENYQNSLVTKYSELNGTTSINEYDVKDQLIIGAYSQGSTIYDNTDEGSRNEQYNNYIGKNSNLSNYIEKSSYDQPTNTVNKGDIVIDKWFAAWNEDDCKKLMNEYIALYPQLSGCLETKYLWKKAGYYVVSKKNNLQLYQKHYTLKAYQDIPETWTYKKEYSVSATQDVSIDAIYTYDYKLKYNNSNSVTSCEIYHMDKEKFLGNCTYNNNIDTQVPRLLYYLLDYSGILNEETIKVEYKTIPAYISLKELMISNIFASINGESSSPTINYLSGWKINVQKNNGYLNGKIEIDINELAKNIGTSGASVTFNTGLSLSFTQLSDDVWNFTLEQFDSNKYLISANMKSGSVSMSLNVKIVKSTFNFTASNSPDMNRWNSFVEAYKNSGLLNQTEYYVSNINAGATDVDAGAQWDWPFFYLKVTCSYSINYNKDSANLTGSKVGDSTFFKYIEF